MRSRFEMIKEVGFGHGLALTGVSIALYVAVAVAIVVGNLPARTGQALLDLVSPSAQASELATEEASTPVALPTSVQAKTWDKVEYGEHDFDPLPGQIPE